MIRAILTNDSLTPSSVSRSLRSFARLHPRSTHQSNAGWRRGQALNRSEQGSAAWRFAGAGLELAGTVLFCMALGYAIDNYLGSDKRVGTAAGALLGFAASMTRLIRLALALNRDETNAD